ncbi:DNA mismatch endonuclease Vsr [Methanocella conradii HZ254]|uniref:DNA mismatch endonuclease Vsr n=1 Tax=Methanocella conradii (strain DSM 24694 / JCM 17849 / CGMCC 1.5162 / HZ254) TaxID=1041930 RepID=H8I439_METCZ|nr:very short patch repair endonuclease [Methanocella conradii]AFC99178.1 DNA mismatch endonuclease Vsr [Methanocella conradii HZ254]
MDRISPAERSKIMSKIKAKNTKAEIILRKELWKLGIRGYRIHYNIPGKPDIAFVSKKIAIFIDGDFWHGYLWKYKGMIPPRQYWQDKIEKNMLRDQRINTELKNMGWKVIRIWEHEVLNEMATVVNKLLREIQDRSEN